MELLIDGELSVQEESEVMNHIRNCTVCSKNYTSQSHFKQTLQTKLPRKLATPSMVDHIRNHIQKIA